VIAESFEVTWPALVVHGGAGRYAQLQAPGAEAAELARRVGASLEAAVDAGWPHLTGGDPDPVQAVVAAVAALEQDGGFNAGRGSVPTSSGAVEMDAAVVDDRGQAGGVACVTEHVPIKAAEAVFRLNGPVLLAGPNADRFAASMGTPTIGPIGAEVPLSTEGTVGAVAVTANGRFAAASSTGGRAGQLPGRVGDTPIPGAGLWAVDGCAVAATGAGEAFLLGGFSRAVAQHHMAGMPLPEALQISLLAVARYGGDGGAIALSADRTWAAVFDTAAMARSVRHAGGRQTVVLS
jgi:isoaspartyl peptidase/L-asparaginase-like protein (Ntn-hydrolase superfamily)